MGSWGDALSQPHGLGQFGPQSVGADLGMVARCGKGVTWVHFIKQSYWEVDPRGTVGGGEIMFAGLL